MTHGSPRGHKNLTFRHRIAVNAFLSGMTQREAMVEAGYSPKSAPDKVFGREDVKHEIERLQESVAAKFEVSQEWVVERLVRIAESGTVLAKFKKIDSDGKLYWDFTDATQEELALIDDLTVETSIVGKHSMKVGVPGRQKAIDSLCRVLGFNKDKLDISGSLSLVERLQRGRERVRKK